MMEECFLDLKTQEIDYPGYGSFKVYASNEVLKWRANSFLTKEPTTLQWMQGLENSVLIDVGINIGIYTLPYDLPCSQGYRC